MNAPAWDSKRFYLLRSRKPNLLIFYKGNAKEGKRSERKRLVVLGRPIIRSILIFRLCFTICTYHQAGLCHTTQRSPRWGPSTCAGGQEIPCSLWTLKMYCRVDRSLLMAPILSHINAPITSVYDPLFIYLLHSHLCLDLPNSFCPSDSYIKDSANVRWEKTIKITRAWRSRRGPRDPLPYISFCLSRQ